MRTCSEHKMQVSVTDNTPKLHEFPESIIDEIFNKLENAKYIATARCVCKCFNEASKRIRSVRFICLDKYHESIRYGLRLSSPKISQSSPSARAQASRGKQVVTQAINSDVEGLDSGGKHEPSTSTTGGTQIQHLERKPSVDRIEGDSHSISKGESSTAVAETTQSFSSDEEGSSSDDERPVFIFRNVVERFLEKQKLVQLRLEIEGKLQSKYVSEAERRRTDFWLSDPMHLTRWVPNVKDTLQHLCIVDYGQQAIMRRSSILEILSKNCKKLKTLDLRNMFIDSSGLEDMPALTSITLRCVKELLYGASSFDTLTKLVAMNPSLNKLFLDIPCMTLGGDGKWLGVLPGVPLFLPNFKQLLLCERLGVLNIGPGLWHSMEVNLETMLAVKNWPSFKRLILHMIPGNLDACTAILRTLLKPTLTSLELYIHTSSPVSYDAIVSQVSGITSNFDRSFSFKPLVWTKCLNFSCFSL
uniref:F-box domain-containing protein n=1 Tax=Physcomitrium patens TaxID=3218 RepID=A0A7I4DN00_PHYPA